MFFPADSQGPAPCRAGCSDSSLQRALLRIENIRISRLFAAIAFWVVVTWPQPLSGASIDDIAIDTQGNIFVSVDDFHQVLKIAPNGDIAVFAGTGEQRDSNDPGGDGGPAVAAKLNRPSSVTVDSRTNEVYIADSRKVRKMDSNGIIATVAGNGSWGDDVAGGEPATEFALGWLRRIEFDSNSGRLYLLQEDGRIWRVENGRIFHHAGNGERGCPSDGGLAAEAQFRYPIALAVGLDGSLYVADSYYRIHKIDPDGSTIAAVVGNGRYRGSRIPDGAPALRTGIRSLDGLAFDADNRLHFVGGDGIVYRLERNGTLTLFSHLPDLLGESARGSMVFETAGNLFMAGHLFIADQERVFEVSEDGRRVRVLADLESAAVRSRGSAAAAKSELPEPPQIIGGRVVGPGRWPFVVRIDTPTKFCTGSLVAPNWILTAAHCLVDHDGSVDDPSDIAVFLGHDWDKGVCENTREEEEIGRVVVHPDYDYVGAGFRNDAALVEILRPAAASPVNILTPGEEAQHAPSGAAATVIGWGRLSNGSYPRVLREVEIPLMTPEDCRENSFWESDVVHERTLCAGVEGKGHWSGDSGGPLVVSLPDGEWGQVGTTSMGGGARTGYPGVFTRTSSIYDWIYEHAGSVQLPLEDAVVNAASFTHRVTPESIVSLFGSRLARETIVAGGLPLPTELGGIRVEIVDGGGVMHLASLFFVGPRQINFLMPAEIPPGRAAARVTLAGNTAQSEIRIHAVAPGLFSANGTGEGVGAITAIRVAADGSRSTPDVFRRASNPFDASGRRFVAAPIDLGPEEEKVFLSLFGTGLRRAERVAAAVGGEETPILFSGALDGFAGLDQVNIGPLPRSLTGAGEVDLIVTADGIASNAVTVAIE